VHLEDVRQLRQSQYDIAERTKLDDKNLFNGRTPWIRMLTGAL
jgi:hypothetical protein